jgi:hypothetical protein
MTRGPWARDVKQIPVVCDSDDRTVIGRAEIHDNEIRIFVDSEELADKAAGWAAVDLIYSFRLGISAKAGDPSFKRLETS